MPTPGKHLTPEDRLCITTMRKSGLSYRDISKKTRVPLATVHATVQNVQQWAKCPNSSKLGEEKKGRGRPRITTEDQDQAMIDEALSNRFASYEAIQEKIAPGVSVVTVKRRFSERNLRKWIAKRRTRLDPSDAEKRLAWAHAHEHWTKLDWLTKCMWGDEVTVERGGGRRPRWVFRYPHEKWHSECIDPDVRTSEKKVSQMMTGCFSGSGLGMLVPVFKDPESAGVTGRSIIKEFDTFFMDVWNDAFEGAGGGDFFFIIDNARTHLPLKRWLLEKGVRLKEIPPYSPDLNPIEHIWSLLKHLMHKFYSHLYKLKGEQIVKKELEEAIVHCWELLKSPIFQSLAESMVDRVQAVIEADGWYTKY